MTTQMSCCSITVSYTHLDVYKRQADTIGFVLRKVFARKAPWIIALSSMCIGLVRHSIDHWYTRYIVAVFGVTARTLGSFGPYQFASVAMPIAAVIGGLVAGNASDRLFQSRRAPVIFFAFLGMAACMTGLRGTIHNAWGAAVVLVAVSFFVPVSYTHLDVYKRQAFVLL